jgi:hypothetical protein
VRRHSRTALPALALTALFACNGGGGAASTQAQTAEALPSSPPGPPVTIAYDAKHACVAGRLYSNDVLPAGEGEFETNGLDRAWWGRLRGNTIGGHHYSGFQTSWGRHQYDTYFGDPGDGLPGHHDPFYVGADSAVAGAPRGVRIAAIPMPDDIYGNPSTGGANWYSGVLDTPVNLQYGFFVARVRLPRPLAGMSPAWWMVTNNGTPQGSHGPLNGEWDIQEMFGYDLGNGLNSGTILLNSGASTPQNWGGSYAWPASSPTTPSGGYHDYGALIAPGGAKISPDLDGPGGPGSVAGTPGTGVTDYLDGAALPEHIGGADVTSGVGWKELMAMFQVGATGGWLGTPNPSAFPAFYWVQWIRVYRPTAGTC